MTSNQAQGSRDPKTSSAKQGEAVSEAKHITSTKSDQASKQYQSGDQSTPADPPPGKYTPRGKKCPPTVGTKPSLTQPTLTRPR
ncbi:hypothetical protein PUNSTDRAFT_134788 [Punctularia strigosozonata HHB-11173 SS5]|uniref:uncharacterized protein n=1 Tax=Punctularia strigosozonata (strain HHB-11173) TaxID=741275 RepID=UPI0004417D1A|nr:uncharacterized protein PUNSTDRAFT_134788 [Punctularia strigosozonata HHB-11173 SS5]EIN08405.1 hypothetical protein PUNSTDRAFT_134788 [Punctularia strigosozonata HHB-11173 SS5]